MVWKFATGKIRFFILISVILIAGYFVLLNAKSISSKFFAASISQSLEDEPESSQSSESSSSFSPAPTETGINAEISPEQLAEIRQKLDFMEQELNQIITQRNKQKDEEKKEKKKPKEEADAPYPKILISEVMVSSGGNDKWEYVELYNPNNFNVDLNGWYLQRKTAGASDWSSYATSALFEGKTIFANGYFLISRTGFYQAEIFTDKPITNDNSFALKNPNGEISDKLGFGKAGDFEFMPASGPGDNQAIGRKAINGSEQDTDTNFSDFELQTPTPHMPNLAYTGPIPSNHPTQSPSGGIVSASKTNYPKILISEVKIAEKIGDKNIFLELYNPNNSDLDMTDWYIFRNNTSFITKSALAGKAIPANNYFLLAKQDSGFMGSADVIFDGTLNEDDKLTLKNPNGDEADQASWTAVQIGASWGRKWDSQTNSYGDFELDNLTPSAQNMAYVIPPIDNGSNDIGGSNDVTEPSGPSIKSYVISNPEISAENPITSIDFEFSEKVKANVDILDSAGQKVKDLYYSSGVTNPQPKIWDGKNNSGASIPNGIYTIKVEITNPAGNYFEDASRSITVNFLQNTVE
jgi:hypothetical protein